MTVNSMSKSRFSLVLVCIFVFLCFSVSSFANQKDVPAKVEDAASIGQVNINTASLEQLVTLPGIGAALAERIIKHRTEVGMFEAPAELTAVKGVGQKKLDKMINLIVVK